MKKIVVAGEKHSGKSLLCYSLSKYYRKNEVGCSTANLDPSVKHLKHLPSFDLRKTASVAQYPELSKEDASKKILTDLNYHALDRELNKVLTPNLLIDTPFSLEELLTARIPLFSYCDCLLFLTSVEKVENTDDELLLKAIAALVSFKQEVPTLLVVNKNDLKQKAKKRFLDFSYIDRPQLESFAGESLIYASALEKTGLREIAEAIENIS